MKYIQEITSFQCNYCHQQFNVKDFISIDHAKQACYLHEIKCLGKPKINLGDVVIFNDFKDITKNSDNDLYYQTPPLFITKINKSQQIIYYHCVFTKIDIANMTWMEDKVMTENWFKNSQIKYFIFSQLQINRKLNMKDLLKVYKFLYDQQVLYKGKAEYSDRNIRTLLKPNFNQSCYELTIKIPFKTLR